jgi:hypothetical protein
VHVQIVVFQRRYSKSVLFISVSYLSISISTEMEKTYLHGM